MSVEPRKWMSGGADELAGARRKTAVFPWDLSPVARITADRLLTVIQAARRPPEVRSKKSFPPIGP